MDGTAYDCRIRAQARIVVSGASGSGKSQLIKRMLLNFDRVFEEKPARVYIFYQHWQPSYEELRAKSLIPVTFLRGPPPGDKFQPEAKSILVFDDLQSTDSSEIQSWFFRKAHHLDCSVIYVVQNIFAQNKTNRTISLNANYLCMCRLKNN